MSALFDEIVAHGGVRSLTDDVAWLQAMLDVEAGLARALADVGMIPAADAEAIATVCVADLYDVRTLAAQATSSGNPVPALVGAVTDQVGQPAGGHVHRGATSQDVLDTACMLLSAAASDVIVNDLRGAAAAAAGLGRAHRGLPAAGRTLLQHAVPTTFGRRAVGWMAGLDDAAARLVDVRGRLPVQLGGAAGTLASLGEAGPAVAASLAARLGLAGPVLPWHTMRVPIADLAGVLGTAAGVCATIARDVTLLAQTEVGEVREAVAGRGGSSTMPHKHNPVAAVAALGAAATVPGLVATLLTAMCQEHERAAGAWHAEWATCTRLLRATGSAAAWVRDSLDHLEVDGDQVRANAELTGGLTLAERITTALTPALGRLAAHDLLAAASDRALADGTDLHTQLLRTPEVTAVLDEQELAHLLDLDGATVAARAQVDRALAHHDAVLERPP